MYAHGGQTLQRQREERLSGLQLMHDQGRLGFAWMTKKRVIRAMERGIPTRSMF